MKTLTEFNGFTLRAGLAKQAELSGAGKSPEEMQAGLGEAHKYEGDKLAWFTKALEAVHGQVDRIKRVLVMQAGEGEPAPRGSVALENNHFLMVEQYPQAPQKQARPGREERGGRGGRGDKKGRGKGRGGRGGDRGERGFGGGGGEGRGPRPPRGDRAPRAEAAAPTGPRDLKIKPRAGAPQVAPQPAAPASEASAPADAGAKPQG
jgi:hypothetical protein